MHAGVCIRAHSSDASRECIPLIFLIILNDIALDELILTQPFACDLDQCKGACCTLKGGSGAPLRDDEAKSLADATPAALQYLSRESQAYIAKHGIINGEAGDLTVQCIDDAQCVFVYFEKDIARCALERAYLEGQNEFRKPISCHLFPIRVADFGGPYLYYEEFSECRPAFENGRRTHSRVVDCTRDALSRDFGEEWTEAALNLAAEEQSRTDSRWAKKPRSRRSQ